MSRGEERSPNAVRASTAAGESEQRREHVRAPAVIPVTVWREDDESPLPRIATYAIDLSGGGFQIAGPSVLAPGDVFSFELALPGRAERIGGMARVIREVENGALGCEFEEIAHAHREWIVKQVFVAQRAGLRERFDDEHDPTDEEGIA